jgi:methionyl-tRNA synthetase
LNINPLRFRYCRLKGYTTLYVCGTDEYGTATETKALEEKISCQELCDKYHKLHRDVYEHFEIDFDHFGRTTTPHQTEISQEIFLQLYSNGFIIKDTMQQLFCEQCQRFLADRYVEGTCPHCKYPDARGDQCDSCQKLLNSSDLIQPRCKLDGNTPITRETTHLFLDLPQLQSQLVEFVNEKSEKGKWSANSIAITRAWLKEGLKPRCITRDLKWGTAVPLEGFEEKVFYVWFDAPIGYPSITANLTGPTDWKLWWKNPDQVQLYQFMGKDNIPFHTVIFPSSLLGTKQDWTLLHHVSTTEYLNYEGGKFSKSRKTGVFGSSVRDTGIPISVWRYYLFANRPETSDSDFSWKDFIARNNNELLNNVGNFVNRIVKFVNSKYDSKLATFDMGVTPLDVQFVKDINELLQQYSDALENVKLRQGLQLAMAVSARGNQYLQDNKLDNSLFADQRSRCDTVVGHAINVAFLLSALFYPYMPSTSAGILRQLNAEQPMLPDAFDAWLVGPHCIGKAEYLFKRLDEKLEEKFRSTYGGQSAGSNGAPAEKKTKSKSKKAEDPMKLFEKLDSSQVTVEINSLKEQVSAQGEKVKQLKTSGANATELSTELETLLKLKADMVAAINKILSS